MASERPPSRAPRGHAAVALALLGLAACGEGDPLASQAEIDVSPKSIEFGAVATGESRTVELRVRNTSPTGTLRLDRFELAPGAASAFRLGAVPGEIDPSKEAVVLVHYTADDGEPDAAQIQIDSNATLSPRLVLPITSARTFPDLEVRPRQIDLGGVAAGTRDTAVLRVGNLGLAPLVVRRMSIRTEGFAGESCAQDADCRVGRCTPSRTGPICATACTGAAGECAPGYACTRGVDGYEACREDDGTTPPRASRGFHLAYGALAPIPPRGTATVAVAYAPAIEDRGSVQLVLETNDPGAPFHIVPLVGRPENLPPIARASADGPVPSPLEPGGRVALTAAGSFDPEGTAITYVWRFVRRPEGSRATFADPTAERTGFAVDLPGTYVAGVEVRDASRLASTNDARVEVESLAGSRVRIQLDWDRPDTDLDLHLVSPGAPVGSVGDCFEDNPSPDWLPMGPLGDPVLTSTTARETIAVEAPARGVYTIVVRVPEASPQGAAGAEVRVFLNDVEAARFEAILPRTAEQWDVATLSRPSGRLIPLGTVR